MSSPNKPAHEVRLGAVKATVWRNEHVNGIRYNTVLSKSYREGEQWKSTDNFGRDDLLLVAKVADAAHSWIFAQAREAPGGPSGAHVAPSPQGRPAAVGSSGARAR